MMSKLFAPALCVSVLGTVALAVEPAAPPAPQTGLLPCEVSITSPSPSPSPTTAPTAPTNLRILGGSGGSLFEPDALAELLDGPGSGPFVDDSGIGAAAVPGPHDYYAMLANRSDCLRAYSLRDPKQLDHPKNGGYAHSNTRTLMVTYDYANDPDPRRQDAAKIVVGIGSNSLTNQVRVPIPRHSPDSLFVTWDAWFGREWQYGTSGIPDYKTFQFGSPYHDIHMEVRNRFALSPNTAGLIDGRLYPEAGNYSVGPNVTKWDTLEPRVATFHVQPETWTRWFAYFKAPAPGSQWYEYSLWAADANTGPVLIYDRLLVRPSPDSTTGSWEAFWLEYNTSTATVKLGRPDLISYARNVVVLKGVTNPSSLLIRP